MNLLGSILKNLWFYGNLEYAIFIEDEESVYDLCRDIEWIDASTREGRRILRAAFKCHSSNILKTVIKKTINLDKPLIWTDEIPFSIYQLLHEAVKENNLLAVKLLLEKNVDPNGFVNWIDTSDEKGLKGIYSCETPLDLAMENGNDAIVDLLKQHLFRQEK